MTDNVVSLDKPARVTVVPVARSELPRIIMAAEGLLSPAVDRVSNDVRMEDIWENVWAGRNMLWLVYVEDNLKAALTTSVVEHPRRKNLKVEFMGGKDMHLWMDAVADTLADVARHAELDAVEADGRKGFEKFVSGSRFEPTHTRYVMELGQ